MEPACPSCHKPIAGKDLQGSGQPPWKSFRYCPHCRSRIVVDGNTRKRQIFSIFLSVIALVLILFLFRFRALFPYVVGILFCLFVYVYQANKKVKFEHYRKNDPDGGS